MKYQNFAMAEFPFQLLIKNTSSKNEEEILSCTALLRVLPGRREVYDALWNDRGVIVKVFSHWLSAKRHLKRDWDGLNRLTRRGLNSPQSLFYGKTEDGRWAMVVEKIANSRTVLDMFQKSEQPSQKLGLLISVCKELAAQHKKGVLQKDLHLGNFMLADEKVFLLDPGQMRFLHSKVNKKTGISQIAMLARYLSDSDTESIAKLHTEYLKARGWQHGKADEILLTKQLVVHRKKGAKRGLKKCLRTGKRYLKVKSAGFIAVFDRVFCQGAEPRDFIEKIDGLMDKGKILKNGNTCYVSRLMWNGEDTVVKRYNHKGFIHSLRHTIKKSRARQGWVHAHRLRMLQIATPKPLAYIEKRRAGLIWQSYLVTKYVEGQRLYDFLRNSNIAKEDRSIAIQQVKELVNKMEKYRTTHGDLKHTNILITEKGPVLTDLDGMKAHKLNWTYRIRRPKDRMHLEDKETSIL